MVCFHCACSLSNFNAGDNAWEEHAKWSPTCPFLLLLKGEGFVQNVQKSMKTCDFVDRMMKQEPAVVS